MNVLLAAVIALAPSPFPVPPPGPALNHLCYNQAFASAHEVECRDAIAPPDYLD